MAARSKAKPAKAADAPSFDLDTLKKRITECSDLDVLDLIADDMRDLPEGDIKSDLMQAYSRPKGGSQRMKHVSTTTMIKRLSACSYRRT